MWLAQPNGGHFSIATAVFMNEIAQPPPGNPANVTPIGDCKASNAQAATRVRHETVSRAAASPDSQIYMPRQLPGRLIQLLSIDNPTCTPPGAPWCLAATTYLKHVKRSARRRILGTNLVLNSKQKHRLSRCKQADVHIAVQRALSLEV
jgi:hypothetical protein